MLGKTCTARVGPRRSGGGGEGQHSALQLHMAHLLHAQNRVQRHSLAARAPGLHGQQRRLQLWGTHPLVCLHRGTQAHRGMSIARTSHLHSEPLPASQQASPLTSVGTVKIMLVTWCATISVAMYAGSLGLGNDQRAASHQRWHDLHSGSQEQRDQRASTHRRPRAAVCTYLEHVRIKADGVGQQHNVLRACSITAMGGQQHGVRQGAQRGA
jgi:hypothetical protein